jgi:hypothetical protein
MGKKKGAAWMKCGYCGKTIKKTREWKKYCGPECRLKGYNQRFPRVPREELERLRAVVERG